MYRRHAICKNLQTLKEGAKSVFINNKLINKNINKKFHLIIYHLQGGSLVEGYNSKAVMLIINTAIKLTSTLEALTAAAADLVVFVTYVTSVTLAY